MANEAHPRRSDALAMGLFGLAVGAFTVGLAQFGEIPERNHLEIAIIVFVCGGLMPFLAGMILVRSREPYCGIALTTYGLFSIAVCIAELVSASIGVQRSPILYGQLNVVYFLCSAVVVYLTAYRGTTICLLFFIIAATSCLSVLASLGLLTCRLNCLGLFRRGALVRCPA